VRYSLKQDEAEARERLRAFWAGSSLGRPALYAVARTAPEPPIPPEWARIDPKQRDYEPGWHAWQAERTLANTTFLAEAMPSVIPRFGSLLTLLAVLAGGAYEYDDSAWIQPMPDVYERDLPTFDPAHPAVRALEASLDTMARTVGSHATVTPPTTVEGLTTLSLLREPARLCLDLVERPHDVLRWNEALTSLYVDCYEHFYRHVSRLGYGETTTWLRVFAEGSLEAVQCDFSVMISPEMYRRFVLSQLERTVAGFDNALYHLDGTCQMRWLDILRGIPGLNGIQWNPEMMTEPQTKWIEAFQRIRSTGLVLYTHANSVEEAEVIAREVGPDGLFIVLPVFGSVAEAESAVSRIAKACGG
jgi:hypothetical protein